MTDYSCTEPPYVESSCPNFSPLYNDMEFYLPSSTSNSKIVRLNFFFIHKDDGTGNFLDNDPEHQQAFNDIIATMNHQMANLNNCLSLSVKLKYIPLGDDKCRELSERFSGVFDLL
jgi:hypothetical protein